MEVITIAVHPLDIIVLDGKLPNSRLKFAAPGLEIYLHGKVSVPRRNAVSYMAMECALARHIPLISLKAYGWI